jgi:hypothetical protein
MEHHDVALVDVDYNERWQLSTRVAAKDQTSTFDGDALTSDSHQTPFEGPDPLLRHLRAVTPDERCDRAVLRHLEI